MAFGASTRVSVSRLSYTRHARSTRADIVSSSILVDYILFTTLDTEHTDNPNEVMDSCYVTKEELQKMFVDPGALSTLRRCHHS